MWKLVVRVVHETHEGDVIVAPSVVSRGWHRWLVSSGRKDSLRPERKLPTRALEYI